MRPVQFADIEAALRHLLQAPSDRRWLDMADLCARADIADRHRRRTGARHPGFGDGTLMAAALGQGIAPRPAHCSDDVLACLQIVTTVLRAKQAHHDP